MVGVGIGKFDLGYWSSRSEQMGVELAKGSVPTVEQFDQAGVVGHDINTKFLPA